MNVKLIRRLRQECEIMHSRMQAILNCDAAIDQFMAYDVFGRGYRGLLESDCKQLTEAIQLAKDALRDSES